MSHAAVLFCLCLENQTEEEVAAFHSVLRTHASHGLNVLPVCLSWNGC